MRTGIEVTAFLAANREREIVATRFTLDPKIGAAAAPLRPVRRDSATTGASLCQEVCQFVAQRPIDFRFAVRDQTAIEKDARGTRFSAAGRRTEAS